MHNKIYDKVIRFIKENIWFFVSLFFIIFLFNFQLPYYIEAPGGFISLNDRIKIEDSNKVSGDYGMAYVSMLRGTLPFLGCSLINNDWDIISKDEVSYKNESLKEMNEREKIYLNEAISNATYVAYKYADKSVFIDDLSLYVTYLENDDTELKLLDIILKINDTYVSSVEDIREAINNTNSDYIDLLVLRDNKELKIKSSIKEIDGKKYVGMMITPNYNVTTNPKVDINIKNNESGPSGGLMLAIAIYSKISNIDLTKGDKIIGTGTIDMDGNVGEIGGVKYKLIGAVKKGAKVFLCPKDNYEEAISVKKDKNYNIEIVSVDTFDDAINYLKGR